MITKTDNSTGCEFVDDKTKNQLLKIECIGSPTSNCQVASFTTIGNNFHKLTDANMILLFKRIKSVTYKTLFLFSSSKKREINRILKFINENKNIDLKVNFQNKKGVTTLLIHSKL